MSSPKITNRAEVYTQCGVIFANTAARIGVPMSSGDKDRWVETMQRLETADEISEEQPEVFAEPSNLLDHLRLPTSEALLRASANLLGAAAAAPKADTINRHFLHRANEALACVDLLAYNHDRAEAPHAWDQLNRIAVAGNMLDSTGDAVKDSEKIPQFTAAQLAVGGLRRFVETAATIDPLSWSALMHESAREGLVSYYIKKPVRILRYARQSS